MISTTTDVAVDQALAAMESRPLVYYCLVAGAIIASTTALALAILGITSAASVCGVLFVVDVVGAYNAPRSNLEASDLLKQVPILRQEAEKWKKMLEQEQKDHAELKQSLQGVRESVKEKTEALGDAVHKFQDLGKQSEKMQRLETGIQKSVRHIRRNSEQILKIADKEDNNIGQLTRSTSQMQLDVASMEKEAPQIKLFTEAVERKNKEIEKLTQLLEEERKAKTELQEANTKLKDVAKTLESQHTERLELQKQVLALTALIKAKQGK